MSQFTFFADVLTALGGAIEKDKKKTKPEGTKIPFRSGLSEVDTSTATEVPEIKIPVVQDGRPHTSEYVDTGIPHYQTRLDDPNRGIMQPNGMISTHKMRAEIDPATGKMTAFPMIVDMPGLGRLHEFTDPNAALDYNKSLNNVKVFDDPQEGIDYAEGGYKKGTALNDNTPEGQFSQQFGSVPLMGNVPEVKQPSELERRITEYLETDKGKKIFPAATEERRRAFAKDIVLKDMEREREKLSKNTPVSEQERDAWRKANPNLFPQAKPEAIDKIIQEEKYGVTRDGKYFNAEVKPLALNEDDVPLLIGKKSDDKEVDQEVVTNNNIISDPSNQEAKVLIDNAVDETLITEDFPRLMPGEGSSQQTIEETFNQEILDNKNNVVKDPKKSFLSKLWDGVKDVIVTQVQDPANQRALFAYAVSRALGYDGVTLASQVLANEWEQKAATTKHERELERIYGKEKIAAMKKQRENQTIDYSKPVVLYNADQNQNVTVYLSKDNQSFTFGTGDTQPYSIQSLLSKGYVVGEGLDFEDQRQVLTDFMLTDAETITGDLIDELNANEDIKPGVRQGIIKELNNAKSPYVIREAMVAFTNKYGKTADYNSSDVQAMASRGIQNYLRAVSQGRAKGSKDLIGYMDYEALTYDISKTNIPEAFFSIAGNPEQEIGVNGWSRTNNVVGKITNNINSRLGKGSYTEADIYGVLSDEFLKEFGDGTNKFATYWTKASKNTSDKKAEAVSPAMLWIQGIVSGQEASPDYKSPSLKEVLDMLADRKKS